MKKVNKELDFRVESFRDVGIVSCGGHEVVKPHVELVLGVDCCYDVDRLKCIIQEDLPEMIKECKRALQN